MTSIVATTTAPLNAGSSCAIKQASSSQDFSFCGKSTNGEFDFIGVADGHGNQYNRNVVINMIKDVNWMEELQNPDFFRELVKKTSVQNTTTAGATLTVFKIYPDRFECTWLGDSSGKLYSEGKCIWRTKDHDRDNTEELERLSTFDLKVNITTGWDIKVIDPTLIRSVKSELFHFDYRNIINMTNSLGHAGLTGGHISTTTIPREEDKNYKIVCATDGLWAMTYDGDDVFLSDPKSTSAQIVEFADQRWRQEWNHDDTFEINKGIRFPDSNIDDIAVATWTNV